ncbi:MAG TPA: ParB/RepB/Spo0J family partition protein [Nitrososphaeraceae archaeon]|nr:ParB/RepB/Spo0J family partition protein [Nitrososphaeraceae archaeon]
MLSTSVVSYGVIEDLPISEIKLPINQLRSQQNLDELSISIAQKGLLQPIIVRTVDNKPFYEIVAGCRRYLACKKIGRRKVTCEITDLNDKEAFEVSIIENVQRMTLAAMDEAKAFKTYVSDYGWGGVSELAAKLGKSVSYVTKRIMLLNLPKEVKDSIIECTLSPSVAQELIYLQNGEDSTHLAKLIINRHLTTKNVRKMVMGMNNDKNIEEPFVEHITLDSVKKQRSFDKTIITLRIAMNRIGNIINEVDDDWIIHETLMQHKRRLHEQIDVLIKQRKKMI